MGKCLEIQPGCVWVPPLHSITQPPVPLVSLKQKKTRKKWLSLHPRSNSGIQTRPGFPSCLGRMVSLTTLLELSAGTAVSSIDGIPWGRLGLVFLVRRSWTNTPPPAQAACVRPVPALTHLCLQLQLSVSCPTPLPSHFCEFQLVRSS